MSTPEWRSHIFVDYLTVLVPGVDSDDGAACVHFQDEPSTTRRSVYMSLKLPMAVGWGQSVLPRVM